MSLRITCREQPVAGDTFPPCILSGILLCSRAASGIKHSRSLSGNRLKNKYTQPPFLQGPHSPVCRLIYDILRGPQLSGNYYSISYFMRRHICAIPVICKHGCPMRMTSAPYFRRTSPLWLVRGPPTKTAIASSLKNLKDCVLGEVLLNRKSGQTEE